ncbi:olfactory receptor 6N2-like [Dendropsophus ebraccatus]|uniref:olfactory receptor 6N2-like n=1 Tax=Dendropsophus ebraccatus TaxID=150705 RepID=UPI00383109A2
MENLNQTHFKDFILLGFVVFENYSPVLFTAFFTIYVLTLFGNTLIVLVVYNDIHLHKPMYFFITNLACLEIWYVSVTTPKLLTMLVTNNKKISFSWCFVQLYMFHSLGITECNLLAIMSVDRFVAICRPLRYNTIMSTTLCKDLSMMCWSLGFLVALIPVILTSQVPFCGRYYVNHYFCDLAPLLSLSCHDITVTISINRFVGAFNTMFNLAIVVLMYINIIYSIMKIKTSTGRKKAFSTCSSHLMVVTLFYGAACIVYATPKTSHSLEYDKLFALVYAMFTPFLNPIIYSLRNQDVISGLKRGLQSMQRHIHDR